MAPHLGQTNVNLLAETILIARCVTPHGEQRLERLEQGYWAYLVGSIYQRLSLMRAGSEPGGFAVLSLCALAQIVLVDRVPEQRAGSICLEFPR